MLIIILDHSKNIKRLLNGTESKINKAELEKNNIKNEKK